MRKEVNVGEGWMKRRMKKMAEKIQRRKDFPKIFGHLLICEFYGVVYIMGDLYRDIVVQKEYVTDVLYT